MSEKLNIPLNPMVYSTFLNQQKQNMLNFKKSTSTSYENAMYLQNGIRINQDILANKDSFTFKNIDFKNKNKAVSTINGWANKATYGKINQLVSESDISTDTILILLNAIYFNGKWLVPFPIADTFFNAFTDKNGKVTSVNMMNLRNDFKFYEDKENLQFKMMELPFQSEVADGNKTYNYMMWIVLPTNEQTLSAVLKALKFKDLLSYGEQMTKQNVYIRLPKFELNYDLNVKHVLSTMGLAPIFERGTFSITKTGQANVDKIVQKAFIDVNEVGTVAAAASFASSK
jgi:serpin B